jgi:predicted amidohydrolase
MPPASHTPSPQPQPPPQARPATLRVAALQLNSAPDDVAGNLTRATPHAEAAAAASAQLLLLPELYVSGYAFTRALWRTAERTP